MLKRLEPLYIKGSGRFYCAVHIMVTYVTRSLGLWMGCLDVKRVRIWHGYGEHRRL